MVILWFLVLLVLSFTDYVKPLAFFFITNFSSMYAPLIKAGSSQTFSYRPDSCEPCYVYWSETSHSLSLIMTAFSLSFLGILPQ